MNNTQCCNHHSETEAPSLELNELVLSDQAARDAFDRVAAAIIVKFGSGVTPVEALNNFNNLAASMLPSEDGGEDETPTLAVTLQALKNQVGEAIFDKLLANPRIEQLAYGAWQQAQPEEADEEDARSAVVEKLAAQFNGAVEAEDIETYLLAVGL